MPGSHGNGLEFVGTSRFKVVSRLGGGGMGVVYEAIDRDRDGRVALKTLKSMSADALLRFKSEFRSLRDLRHPNLVSLGELIEDAGRWFFTMELIHGVDFLAWVRTGSQRSLGELAAPLGGAEETLATRRIVRSDITTMSYGTGFDDARLRSALAQLATGVAALHAAGKIHRDIKPSNIRVTPEGRVVLLDFGLVRDLTDDDDDFTDSQHVVGTARYMAPEQAAGDRVGPEADWYSVGVMMWQALTGRPPFIGPPMHVLMEKQRTRPTHPRQLVPDAPEDLCELAMELLAIDPAERPSRRRVLEGLAVTPGPGELADATAPSLTRSAMFVGRELELARLRTAYRDTRHGRPVSVLVHGESGVGKSSLAQHFTDGLQQEDPQVVVLAGRCFERESVPYKAVDELMDALGKHMTRMRQVDAMALVPTRASLLADVFPVLRRVEVIAQAPRPAHELVEPRELRAAVFRALRELFIRLGERRPLVLVIDDLQWADADSLALLAEVLRPPDAPPLLLVATMRPDAEGYGDVVAALPGDVRHVEVAPLDGDHARELVALLLGVAGASELDADAVAREARGHPLFIHELVRHVELFGARGRRAMPLEDALWSRIEKLDDVTRKVVEVVAIANAPVAQQEVAVAAEMELSRLAQAVALLRVAYLVRTSGHRRPDMIEVYHDRIRRAVIAHLSNEERRHWHRRLAIALEAASQVDAEALAVHWEQADEPERAARYQLQAAEQAAAALAFDRAAALYRRALAHLAEDAPRRREIRVKLGDALASIGRGAEAAEAYQAALDGASAAEALELQRRAAEQLLRTGRVDEGLVAIERVLRAVGMSLPRTFRRALMNLLYWRARVRMRGLGYELRDETETAETALRRMDICWSIALGLSLVDTVQGAVFQSRHLMLALDAGEPRRLARALAAETAYLASAGQPGRKRAERLSAAALELAEQAQHPYALGITQTTAGMAAFLFGDPRRALALCEPAEVTLRERCANTIWEVMSSRIFTLWALFHVGELQELARRVPVQLEQALERGDLWVATDMRIGLTNVAFLVHGDVARAEAEIDRAGREWSHKGYHLQHYYELLSRMMLDLYRGDGARAWQRIEAGWKPLARSFSLRIELIRIEAYMMRGMVALAAARTAREPRPLIRVAARDARRLAKERAPWAHGAAAYLRAGVAHARGDDETAAAQLTRVIEIYEREGFYVRVPTARARRGALIGGDAGAADVAAYDQFAVEQGLVDPAAMLRMLAPGFDDD